MADEELPEGDYRPLDEDSFDYVPDGEEDFAPFDSLDEEMVETAPSKGRGNNPVLERLGRIADAAANELAIATKDNIFQFIKDIGWLAGKTVEHVGSFKRNPERYFDDMSKDLRYRLENARKRITGGVKGGAEKLVEGAKENVASRTRRVGESAREVGERIKEKGIGGMASGAAKKAGESLERTVSAVAENQLAAPSDLHVPGFDGIEIGEYLGEPVYRKQAEEVRSFVSALSGDKDALPYDLGGLVSERHQEKTREGILSDFIGYGTTDVGYLLMHLKIKRGDYASDPDRTLTKNKITVLESIIGENITSARDRYLAASRESADCPGEDVQEE